MAMTMRAVLAELDRINGQMIDDIGRDELVAAVARAALLGARGNSGVILSQIVRGAAEELASRPGELIDPILVSAAFARAADAAYESVRNPAEGTMLSAVRAMAHRIAQDLAHMSPRRLDEGVSPEEQDQLLAEVLERALDAGEDAVKRGPEQLDVLREAGSRGGGGGRCPRAARAAGGVWLAWGRWSARGVVCRGSSRGSWGRGPRTTISDLEGEQGAVGATVYSIDYPLATGAGSSTV